MDEAFTNSLKSIVSAVLNVDPETISDKLSPETIESWDSFNHLLLISEIEAELGIVFTSKDVESIYSFKELKIIANQRRV